MIRRIEDGMESCVPPGFRFHPTEEELVGYYLTRKVNSLCIDLGVIVDVDLYRIEPWDLQDRCKLGYEDQNEWYFFSHKDKKYPTGTRTNRATAAGFWKATGRDKVVMSKEKMIGMRKTLVFYKGRAPNGRKTDWIMHEYRIQTSEHGPPQEEGWVVCRAFKKQTPNQKPCHEAWENIHPHFYNTHGINSECHPLTMDHEAKLLSSYDQLTHQNLYDQSFGSDQILNYESKQAHLLDLPQLGSPTLTSNFSSTDTFESSFSIVGVQEHKRKDLDVSYDQPNFGGWQSLDNLLASQLSEATKSDHQLPLMPEDYEAGVGHHLNGYQSVFHAT